MPMTCSGTVMMAGTMAPSNGPLTPGGKSATVGASGRYSPTNLGFHESEDAVAHRAASIREPNAKDRQREDAITGVTIQQKLHVTRTRHQFAREAPDDGGPRARDVARDVLEPLEPKPSVFA